MNTLLFLFISLIGFAVLLYFRVTLLLSTFLVATLLLGWSLLAEPSVPALIAAWFPFFLVFVSLNLPQVRRPLLSDKVFAFLKKSLPVMSQTERNGLEAGIDGWESGFFSGNPDWNALMDAKDAALRSDEKEFLDGAVEELCRMLDDWKITNEDKELSPEVWEFMKSNGFFGMTIPKEYGGLGLSARGHSEVVQKLASRSLTAAITVMVPNSLGAAELLLYHGTREQKDYYLPRLASGEEIPCFALTEPGAGSDATSISGTGVFCKGEFNGEEIVGIRLNWEKRLITLAPVATLLGLAFNLRDPDHIFGDRDELGITCALVPTGLPGISLGERHLPLSSAFLVGPTSGKDVFIPIGWIVGGVNGAGQGWKMILECFSVGRTISLPALSVGTAKLAARVAGAHSRVRKQFNLPIGRFEGVEEVLGRIAGRVYLMDSVRLMACSALGSTGKPLVASAIAKLSLTERTRLVVNDGMDILAGAGICMGPRNLLGRSHESLPIAITVEGANILTRSLIIFYQGILRCHPYLLSEMLAVGKPDRTEGGKEFDDAFIAHIGFTLSNLVRTVVHCFTAGRFAMTPGSGQTKRYFQHLVCMSAAFALVSDVVVFVFGTELKRKGKIMGRLSDILCNLYLLSALLKRFESEGRPVEDLPLVEWACDDGLHAIQEAFEGIFQNLPFPVLPSVLRFLVFPFGKVHFPPSDSVGHDAAQLLLSPSVARDRLTGGIFIPNEAGEPLALLEKALKQCIETEPFEGKLRAALKTGRISTNNKDGLLHDAVAKGILERSEMEAILMTDEMRRKVMEVDSFQPEALKNKGE